MKIYLGGNSERATPVPIPNTVVKPFSVDGTVMETWRESRTSLGFKLKKKQCE